MDFKNLVFVLVIIPFYGCNTTSDNKQNTTAFIDSTIIVAPPSDQDSMAWIKGVISNNTKNDSLINNQLIDMDKDAFIHSLRNKSLKNNSQEVEILERVNFKEYENLNSLFVLAEVKEYLNQGNTYPEDKDRTLYFGFTGTKAVKYNSGYRASGELNIGRENFLRFPQENYLVTKESGIIVFETIEHFMYAGGGGTNTTFRMLMAEMDTIREIFSTILQSSGLRAGEYAEDGTRDHYDVGNTDEIASISMLSETSNGLNDLKKTLSEKEVVYKYDGKKYVAFGPDPVEDVNN